MKKTILSLAVSALATTASAASGVQAKLLNPKQASETAPREFRARFETSKGNFEVKVVREWSPLGADRFYNLVKIGFFNNAAFFRVLPGFVAQFGINASPEVSAQWRKAPIQDDAPAGHSNARGTLTFAMGGRNTRTTQLFINFADNAALDGMGFTPIGQITKGMDVVDQLYGGYGEGAPDGSGPEQGRIQTEGDSYLKAEFPKLDHILSAKILAKEGATGPSEKKP